MGEELIEKYFLIGIVYSTTNDTDTIKKRLYEEFNLEVSIEEINILLANINYKEDIDYEKESRRIKYGIQI